MTVEIGDVITPGNEKSFTIGTKTPVATLTDLAPVHLALLDEPVTATLATVSDDGSPQLTPVWLDRDGDLINLNSVRDRLKDRNMRARPEVSIMLLNPANPYHWIAVYGRVVETIDEDDAERGHLATESIDGLAQAYPGTSPYPLRDPNGEIRVLYKVAPSRVLTFGPVGE